MLSRICLTCIGLLAGLTLFSQSIISQNSEVRFALSNLGLNTVRGTITGMEGNINFNTNDLSTSDFNVCVKVSTIETGISKRDEHLKEKDFFHESKYPTICFKSDSIKKTPTGYETTGTLILRGVKKTVTIPFEYIDKTFKGTFIIYRLDYKVGEDTSTFTAGNEIEIEIICVVE